MLAYVFWHWPKSGVDPAAYEQAQAAFHRALRQSAPDGFIRSRVFRVLGNAPWLIGAAAYADWYLLDNAAALDALNVAAVSGAREQPHYALTRAMDAGAGSLLTLRSGQPNLETTRYVTWLTKPREMAYPTFDALMSAVVGIDLASLWRRAFVLGPTPEFGVLSATRLPMPAPLDSFALELTPI